MRSQAKRVYIWAYLPAYRLEFIIASQTPGNGFVGPAAGSIHADQTAMARHSTGEIPAADSASAWTKAALLAVDCIQVFGFAAVAAPPQQAALETPVPEPALK
jgi:hypothetical protein